MDEWRTRNIKPGQEIVNERNFKGVAFVNIFYRQYTMKPYSYREREVIEGGGVYAFYPFDSPLDEYCKGIFKIGMTTLFQRRVGNYHTYLPQGVYTMAILQSPTKLRNGQDDRNYFTRIEREIFKDVEEKDGKALYSNIRVNNRGKTEWIYTDESALEFAFNKAQKKFGGNALLYHFKQKKTQDVPIFSGTIHYY